MNNRGLDGLGAISFGNVEAAIGDGNNQNIGQCISSSDATNSGLDQNSGVNLEKKLIYVNENKVPNGLRADLLLNMNKISTTNLGASYEYIKSWFTDIDIVDVDEAEDSLKASLNYGFIFKVMSRPESSIKGIWNVIPCVTMETAKHVIDALNQYGATQFRNVIIAFTSFDNNDKQIANRLNTDLIGTEEIYRINNAIGGICGNFVFGSGLVALLEKDLSTKYGVSVDTRAALNSKAVSNIGSNFGAAINEGFNQVKDSITDLGLGAKIAQVYDKVQKKKGNSKYLEGDNYNNVAVGVTDVSMGNYLVQKSDGQIIDPCDPLTALPVPPSMAIYGVPVQQVQPIQQPINNVPFGVRYPVQQSNEPSHYMNAVGNIPTNGYKYVQQQVDFPVQVKQVDEAPRMMTHSIFHSQMNKVEFDNNAPLKEYSYDDTDNIPAKKIEHSDVKQQIVTIDANGVTVEDADIPVDLEKH